MGASPEEIRRRVRDRFTRMAEDPAAAAFFPMGASSAVRLGYDSREIAALPAEATAAFSGVGHPIRLLALQPGEKVLDVGCGAGTDAFLAARLVQPGGWVLGVDRTAAMLARAVRARRARSGAVEVGAGTVPDCGARSRGVEVDARTDAGEVRFLRGEATALPVLDASVDAVISNGVFNLCLDKPAMLRELVRVLVPGGRVAMADILLEDHVTPEEVARKGAWSD